MESYGTSEITETWKESNQRMKPLSKYNIEDDINKLFETINIRGFNKGIKKSERGAKEALKKNSMRIGFPKAVDIRISEPVSLKQALRGLCISQASEMAAMKKKVSKPSILDKTMVVETNKTRLPINLGRGNLVEVSLVPEKSTLKFLDKSPLFNHHPHVNQSEEFIEKVKHKMHPSNKKLQVLDENIPTMEIKQKSISSTSSGIMRPVSRIQSLKKKKLLSNKGNADNNLSCSLGDPACQKPRKEIETCTVSSCSTSMEVSSGSTLVDSSSSTLSCCEESQRSGVSRGGSRPHMSKDVRWEAINGVKKEHGTLGFRHFKLLKKLGSGDIGTVYLSELVGTGFLFAVKVLDNDFLESRRKMSRALIEKEILEILDHPFLPTLYAHFTTERFSCLVMEYCSGGDLHVLRQRQQSRCFVEQAARFYVAEVLLALEYLHMLGVVYRDLKPENVLVREDGHIMLTDFDLSLRCVVNPTLLNSPFLSVDPPAKTSPCSHSTCIDPFCLNPAWQVSCFTPKNPKLRSEIAAQVNPLPQLVVEPTSARSNSFVGTHEYLAPEVVKGEGHGSAVDWWTFGIFLYELLYGKTPFKGISNDETLANVVSECLKFPESPMVSSHGRDLIRKLLQKEPENRLGSQMGAAEIKQHPFFEGLNFALIRCATPPELPEVVDPRNVLPGTSSAHEKGGGANHKDVKTTEVDIVFEMF